MWSIRISLLSLIIALGNGSAAIADPLAEIVLGNTDIQNRAISAGGVRVLIKNYEPVNYETADTGNLSYEVYVNDVLTTAVQDEVDFTTANFTLENLDPDGVPEVLFERYTGGAHCCSIYTLYSWQGDRLFRTVTYPLDASSAGGFEDLNDDGYSEFLTADDRFLYAFGSYASSRSPLIVLSFRHGTLIDVTRQFPEAMRSYAYNLYETTDDSTNKEPLSGVNGVLAGYVAQKILLGESASGWAYMLAHHDPTDIWGLTTTTPSGTVVQEYADYPEALADFLIDLEYLTINGTPNPYLDLSHPIVRQEIML